MNKTEKILCAGSFITLFGVLIFLFFGYMIIETTGYAYVAALSLTALTTAYWSVFYAYKGKKLKEIDTLWLLGVFLLPFFVLPIFWYMKIYKPNINAT